MNKEDEDGAASQVQLCRECGSEIPVAARKCKGCGSFQDARRFLTVSQSSVTFFLALLALLAHFTSDIRGAFNATIDWVSETKFSMNASLVDINQESLTVILSNRRNHSFGISRATCLINLPADRGAFFRSSRKRNDARWNDTDSPVIEEQQWVGRILLGYELKTPEFFRPFEIRMVTLDRVITGFPGTEINETSEEPTSLCTVMGADQNNSWATAVLVTNAQNLSRLDALELLQEQTGMNPSYGENERQDQLIDDIKRIRRQNDQVITE